MAIPVRMSLYGDFWVRVMRWYARHTPTCLEPFLIGSFTLITFLLAPSQRRGIQRNLAVLLPGSWWVTNVFRSLRVFWNFACSLVDATDVLDGRNQLDWEIQGANEFSALQAVTGGVLILTAHMGNYDIAAPLFAEKFGKKLHTVRLPEKRAERQQFMEATRDKLQSHTFQIHYNLPGSMLAVELTQAIHAGDAVAIQGDRVLGEVAATAPAFDANHAIRIPKGPFILALATRAPVVPLFIIRMGWRRYRVLVCPPLPSPTDPRQREAALAEMTTAWVQTLTAVARTHWRQWFVLEDAFVPAERQPPPELAPPLAVDLITLPPTTAIISRWETALGSLLTTVIYGVLLWLALDSSLGALSASFLVLPLLVLGLQLLTPLFFSVVWLLRCLGIGRGVSSIRWQTLLHYLLLSGLGLYWRFS